jgi:3-phytase
VAEIIQRIRPDVLLLNEFDYDASAPDQSPGLFQTNFLSVSQNGQAAISYPYRYTAPVNTGISSGFDLNRNGTVGASQGTQAYGDDCFGFGLWPGQYGMVVYSKFPIQTSAIRTFQLFLWKNLPGAVLPDFSGTPAVPADWYSSAILNVFRLSSKSHWDVPVNIEGHVVHLLAHHPTPPVFDGAEDRNGRRNHDEIRFWADYITPAKAGYITDDAGVPGGLASGERFLLMGDHNADPFKGDSYNAAIKQLLDHPQVNSNYSPIRPNFTAPPGQEFGKGYFNSVAYDTGDFFQDLRVDYVLPSKLGLHVLAGAVYWPVSPDPGASLLSVSDHRAVHFDMALTPVIEKAVKNLTAQRSGSDIVLQWKGSAGYGYTVQHAESQSGPWMTTPTIPVTVAPITFDASATDVAPTPAKKFYRLEIRLE